MCRRRTVDPKLHLWFPITTCMNDLGLSQFLLFSDIMTFKMAEITDLTITTLVARSKLVYFLQSNTCCSHKWKNKEILLSLICWLRAGFFLPWEQGVLKTCNQINKDKPTTAQSCTEGIRRGLKFALQAWVEENRTSQPSCSTYWYSNHYRNTYFNHCNAFGYSGWLMWVLLTEKEASGQYIMQMCYCCFYFLFSR